MPAFGESIPPPEPEPESRVEFLLLRIVNELEVANYGAARTK